MVFHYTIRMENIVAWFEVEIEHSSKCLEGKSYDIRRMQDGIIGRKYVKSDLEGTVNIVITWKDRFCRIEMLS